LRPHQCHDRLLQVWTVLLGLAVGKAHGVLVAGRKVCARARQAGRVEMREAQLKAFLGTACTRQFLPHQGAALGSGLIEGAAQRAPVAQLGIAVCTKQAIEGWAGKKRRCERQGARGKAQAREAQPGHGCARRDPLWRIGHQACVDPSAQPEVLKHRSAQASVIQTLNVHLFQVTTLP
jgi:hypothetical protein